MNKLLVICGPTATGKTRLALQLAKLFNGEILSADSRQVYRGMNIGTGKDVPKNFKFHREAGDSISNLKFNNTFVGFYTDEKIRLWGYDLVNPKEGFSVSQYIDIGCQIIADIYRRKKMPIIVGGSGLYIRGIVDGIGTSSIPINLDLRNSLEKISVNELFEILSELNPKRATDMNYSDKNNSRRLIRAIEVAKFQKMFPHKDKHLKTNTFFKKDCLFIGLNASKDAINIKIQKRVIERVNLGLEKEIRKLLDLGLNWGDKSMNALGYKEWKPYFEGKISVNDVIKRWVLDERQYAKRQMTWFKKDKRITWFDITRKDYETGVEKLLQKWNNQ